MKQVKLNLDFKNPKTLLICVLAFGVIGTILLQLTMGATPSISIEAEQGVLSGSASIISSAGASGGAAVNFNSTSAAKKLTWPPPGYPNYTGYETINLTQSTIYLAGRMDTSKDYILKLPSTPLKGTLSISGGRNIVLIGGEIQVPTLSEAGGVFGVNSGTVDRFGLKLGNWTGTLHIEGIKFMGEYDDVIRMGNQNAGANLQIQNIWVEKTIGWNKNRPDANGTVTNGPHADLVQTWCGPDGDLRIDGITARELSYQGFFLPTNQLCSGATTNITTIKNVQLEYLKVNPYGAGEAAGYFAWSGSEYTDQLIVDNFWALPAPSKAGSKDNWLWPKPSSDPLNLWGNVKQGSQSANFVDPNKVGLGYVSPGYQ